MSTSDEPLITVEINGLPVALHERAQAHGDELMREFRLLAEQVRHDPSGHVPTRLVELTQQLNSTYAMFTEEQEDALEAAIRSRQATIDLRYRLPAHAADAAAALGALLDEADEFCSAGQHLLTLATPPECLAYRRWFLDEFVRQSAGRPPTRWADSPYAAQSRRDA